MIGTKSFHKYKITITLDKLALDILEKLSKELQRTPSDTIRYVLKNLPQQSLDNVDGK